VSGGSRNNFTYPTVNVLTGYTGRESIGEEEREARERKIKLCLLL